MRRASLTNPRDGFVRCADGAWMLCKLPRIPGSSAAQAADRSPEPIAAAGSGTERRSLPRCPSDWSKAEMSGSPCRPCVWRHRCWRAVGRATKRSLGCAGSAAEAGGRPGRRSTSSGTGRAGDLPPARSQLRRDLAARVCRTTGRTAVQSSCRALDGRLPRSAGMRPPRNRAGRDPLRQLQCLYDWLLPAGARDRVC